MDLVQQPLYLLAAGIFLGAAAGLYLWSEARRTRLLASFGQPATIARLIPAQAAQRRKLRFFLQSAAVALLFAALAGPQWGVELVTNETQGIQALVAVDASLSMSAEDVSPSRMEKAKSELRQILDGLKRERAGVLVFAGQAHIQCPLTTDIEAAKSLLDSVQVGMIPQPGTAIGEALRLGTRILGKYPGQKAIVLVTDGEDRRGDPIQAAQEAASAGIHLYIIGIGTPEGAPIPVKDPQGRTTAYLKDAKGETVISKLGEAPSIQLAAAASGAYYRSTVEESEAQAVLKHISELDTSRIKAGSSTRYKNRFRFPLFLALLLLIVELLLPENEKRDREDREEKGRGGTILERLKQTVPVAALLALSLTGCGKGSTAMELWRGNKDFKKEDYAKALERYNQAHLQEPKDLRPVFNIGDSQYKLGQLEEAQSSFSSIADAEKNPAAMRRDSLFNLGNTRYRKQEYKEALEAYKRCLLLDPEDEGCRFNLIKTLAMLKNPPKKQQQKKDQNQKNQDKKQDNEDKKSQKQNPDKARPQSEMSQEDAERIMQAVREKEKGQAQPKPAWQKKAGPSPGEGVDW